MNEAEGLSVDPTAEAGGGESLLVVDDDPFIARLLEIELRAAGYDVRVASDGSLALNAAQERCPDLVLADVMMPNMDGFELTRRLREIAQKVEFLEAGSPKERIDAALLTSEIDRLYALWGVVEVRGLDLDGVPATPESLAAVGPEELFREAIATVKAECGLTDAERKN